MRHVTQFIRDHAGLLLFGGGAIYVVFTYDWRGPWLMSLYDWILIVALLIFVFAVETQNK